MYLACESAQRFLHSSSSGPQRRVLIFVWLQSSLECRCRAILGEICVEATHSTLWWLFIMSGFEWIDGDDCEMHHFMTLKRPRRATAHCYQPVFSTISFSYSEIWMRPFAFGHTSTPRTIRFVFSVSRFYWSNEFKCFFLLFFSSENVKNYN